MHRILRRLFVISVALFLVAIATYGVLYLLNKNQRLDPEEEGIVDIEARRATLNIDPAFVGAYSSGLKEDGSETLLTLKSDGDTSLTLQQREGEPGVTFGLWEKKEEKIHFYYIASSGATTPRKSLSFDIQENLLRGLDQDFTKLTEGNFVEVFDNSKEEQLLLDAKLYAQTVLGGTNVKVDQLIPTTECANCFTIQVSYLKQGVAATAELKVEGWKIVS